MGTLKENYLVANYGTSQGNFYTAMDFVLDRFQEHLSEFTAFSTIYTSAWAAAMLARLQAARAMPDFQVRDALHEQLNVQLLGTSNPCLIEWKKLDSHIMKAYPKSEHKAMREGAGWLHYRKAGQHDWESVGLLMESGKYFITAHLAELTAGGMPAAFVTGYNGVYDVFMAKYAEFLKAESDVYNMRNAKIAANNGIFDDMMPMLKDGQKIFRHHENIRKNFVYTWVLQHIQGGEDNGAPKPSIKVKTNGGPVNFGARLLGLLKIAWGDGTSVDFNGDPNGTNFIDKVYAIAKLYTILITEKINEIIELHISNSNLTYIKLHKKMKKLEQFIAQGNQFPTKVVDDVLVTINGYGTSGPGKVINLLGSEPPSAKGLAAKAELEARGWTVLVAS